MNYIVRSTTQEHQVVISSDNYVEVKVNENAFIGLQDANQSIYLSTVYYMSPLTCETCISEQLCEQLRHSGIKHYVF